MNIEIGHRAFVEIERAWKEFTSDQTWEGVRTLKNVLQKAMIGREPDPHVVTEEPQADGDIMKAGKDWWGCRNSEDSLYAFEDFVRLIEAKIKAVWKLFRNHEGRIDANKTDLFGLAINFNEQRDRIQPLERKVEELEERLELAEEACSVDNKRLNAVEQKVSGLENHNNYRRTETIALERKVEQLQEEQFKQRDKILDRGDEIGALRTRVWGLEEKSKPQPKGGVAQVCDKDHKELHDLIPGQSVIDCPAGVRIFHHYNPKEQCSIYGYLIRDGKIENELSNCARAGTTHVFDLSFPPFDKAQDVGGDK